MTRKVDKAFCFKHVVPVNSRQLSHVAKTCVVEEVQRVALCDVTQLKLQMHLHYMKSRPLVMTHDEPLLPNH